MIDFKYVYFNSFYDNADYALVKNDDGTYVIDKKGNATEVHRDKFILE